MPQIAAEIKRGHIGPFLLLTHSEFGNYLLHKPVCILLRKWLLELIPENTAPIRV